MQRQLTVLVLAAVALAAAPGCSTAEKRLGPRDAAEPGSAEVETPQPIAAPSAAAPGVPTAPVAPAPPGAEPETAAREVEASHIVVAHILIAHEGSDLVGVTRSIEGAGRLAARVLERAERGEDFTRLAVLHTDDLESDGAYYLANWGVAHQGRGEIDRAAFLRRFGRDVSDAAFGLEIGQTTLVGHDPSRAPLGYSILRRVR